MDAIVPVAVTLNVATVGEQIKLPDALPAHVVTAAGCVTIAALSI
jgi:hypothetical protein